MLSEIMKDLAENAELGAEMHVSAAAQEGDRYFSEGRFEESAKSYRAALESDSKDVRTRFLRGCVLLEMSRSDEARREFLRVVEDEPGAASAVYLAKLAERRAGNPSEDWLTAGLGELGEMDPIPELGVMGWVDDPVTEMIMAQIQVQSGPMFLTPERVAAIAERHAEDREIVLAGALWGLPAGKEERLSEVRAMLETWPVYLAVLSDVLVVHAEKRLQDIAALAKEWEAIEPRNAVPKLNQIAAENWLSREMKRDPDNIPPLSADVVEGVRIALELPDFEDHRGAAVAARLRLLDLAGYPFSLGLLGDLFPSNFLSWLGLRLNQTAKAHFAAGDVKVGVAVADVAIRLGEKQLSAARSAIEWTLAMGQVSLSAKTLRQHYEKLGDQTKAKALQLRTDELKELKPTSEDLSYAALLALPVPSLQRKLIEAMSENELELSSRWKALLEVSRDGANMRTP